MKRGEPSFSQDALEVTRCSHSPGYHSIFLQFYKSLSSPFYFLYLSSISFPFDFSFPTYYMGRSYNHKLSWLVYLPFLSVTEILQVIFSVLFFLLLTASFLLFFFFNSGFLSYVSGLCQRHSPLHSSFNHFQNFHFLPLRCSFLFLYVWALLQGSSLPSSPFPTDQTPPFLRHFLPQQVDSSFHTMLL